MRQKTERMERIALNKPTTNIAPLRVALGSVKYTHGCETRMLPNVTENMLSMHGPLARNTKPNAHTLTP